MDDASGSRRQLGTYLPPNLPRPHRLTFLSQSGINDLKNSIGAKICTPCPSNGEETGTSGTGTVTLSSQSDIDQGNAWLSEFLEKASGQYTFDCVCMHWYGGAGNTLEEDESMIATQINTTASLASQYSITEIIISEMQRTNGDDEVRSIRSSIPHQIY